MMKILMLLNLARGSHSFGSPGTPQACSDPIADTMRRRLGKANPWASSGRKCSSADNTIHQILGHTTYHLPRKKPSSGGVLFFSVAGR